MGCRGCGKAAGKRRPELLPKVPVDDIHPAHAFAEFGSTPAVLAHKAHAVAVVHHNQRVDTVGGNQELFTSAFPGILQTAAQVLHIIVLVAVTFGLAQEHQGCVSGVAKGIKELRQ